QLIAILFVNPLRRVFYWCARLAARQASPRGPGRDTVSSLCNHDQTPPLMQQRSLHLQSSFRFAAPLLAWPARSFRLARCLTLATAITSLALHAGPANAQAQSAKPHSAQAQPDQTRPAQAKTRPPLDVPYIKTPDSV